MFREDNCHAMKILFEEDRENILNALGLFDKKKLIHVQQRLSAESKKIIAPQKEKRRSQLLGIPISVSKFKTKEDRRKSSRNHSKSSDDFGDNVSSKYSNTRRPLYSAPKIPKVRTRKKPTRNSYGIIKGVLIGDKWNTRVECSNAGVHKPTVAGIHAGKEGAYSVAISGDYEDDQDNGYCFTYTAPQSCDQPTDGANASLIRSIETRKPVRVIRGYKLDSPFAPETGYRYDGLYTVEKFWTCVGKSGFLVYKFLMKRCGNQAPAPWHQKENRIKIVKIRKRRPESRSTGTVLNLSGKLTMNEENGDKITSCEVSQMQLQLNTDLMSDSVSIDSSAVISNRDCDVQGRLNASESSESYQKPAVSEEDETGEKSLTDDSNKENSNKVIIKTRWRRSRLSLPSLRSGSSSPQSSTEAEPKGRQYRKRLSCTDRRTVKRIQTSQSPPKIAYFNISNDPSFKWSLFASQEEMKIFKKYFRKNASFNHAADYEGDFKGFERQDSLNKVMILGFIINDIEMKQRIRDAD